MEVGRTIAPPRFLLFCAMFPVATLTLSRVMGLGWQRALLAGFSLAAATFLFSLWPLLRHGEAARMRAQARANDANRATLLLVTGATMLAVLVAVAKELGGGTGPQSGPWSAALVVVTLALAWLFSNTVYALHYAHLFYADEDDQPGDDRGIAFPRCDEPDYWDFVYFAFTLGMTFQTSDVAITARRIRRVVIGHCLAAFFFNLGVIAFTINVLGH
jgi:uncharacterized membrane protein